MGGSPSAMDGGGMLGSGEPLGSYYAKGPFQLPNQNFNIPNGPATNWIGGPTPAKNVNGVGSLDWMKWHPDYKPTPGTAAWGSTHPDPAQNVKYGSAQWQQTHPNYQAPQVPPGLAQIGQPPNDLSDVIKHLFGGGQ